ncbi:MAG: hypothetical protein AB7W59_22345, partial [Acidimicrobiia bacterium]
MVRPRPGRVLRTSTALLLVVLIPLAAGVTTIVRQLQVLDRAAGAAALVESSAQRAVDLSALQAGVLHEMNARSAVVSVQALGLAPELVRQLIGVDLAVELESAEQRVDTALDRLALPDIGAQLADLRADESLTMSDCLVRYERIAQAINVPQEATFRSLAEGTSGVQHGGPELL